MKLTTIDWAVMLVYFVFVLGIVARPGYTGLKASRRLNEIAPKRGAISLTPWL